MGSTPIEKIEQPTGIKPLGKCWDSKFMVQVTSRLTQDSINVQGIEFKGFQ